MSEPSKDELLLQAREDIAQVRAELQAYRSETKSELSTIKSSMNDLFMLVERGKVLIWLIGVISAFIVWVETRWQLVTKTIKAMLN